MIDYDLRFKRLNNRGILSPIKGLPCPLCKVDFAECEHSIAEVNNVIRVWKDKQVSKKYNLVTD